MGLAALRQVQLGKETTAGTAVAAAIKAMGVTCSANLGDRDIVHPIDERGSLANAHRAYVPSLHWRGSKLSGDVTYEEIAMIFEAAIKGGISPSTVDTNARKYLYAPSLTAANTPKTFTCEIGDDTQEYEAEYCFVPSFEIAGGIESKSLTFSADLIGRQLTASTFTGSLADRVVISALSELTKLYMDDSGGTIGTTQKTVMLLDWTWRLVEHFVEKRHQDGNLYFTAFGEVRPKIELNITAEFNASLATLRTKFASATAGSAGTLQLVRLKTTDPVIIGSVSATRELVLDGAFRIMDFKEFGEHNGASTVQLALESEYDSTYAKLFEVYVQNALTALAW